MNELLLVCDKKIKDIHSKYPPYVRSCLYDHLDEILLNELYEICHILMTGRTSAESDREECLRKAIRAKEKGKLRELTGRSSG